jgi:3-oxoacyl-[acyl-carrier protein] reductase
MPRLSKLSRSIAGRVAIVTGSASGMGRATAHLFADEGAKVAVVDLTAAGVDAVVGEIGDNGGTASGYVVDISDPVAIQSLVDRVRVDLGPIDIVVNNAGISMPNALDAEGWPAAWERTMAVNLSSHAWLIRACLADLRRNGEGRIVNIASTEGLGATARMSPYTASKHAVIGLTRSLAVEFGPIGVTVNAVCPGAIRTGLTDEIPEEAKTKFARRRVPMRRYAVPEEVAHATLSAVLPAMSYMTGAVIVVDGGLSIQNT